MKKLGSMAEASGKPFQVDRCLHAMLCKSAVVECMFAVQASTIISALFGSFIINQTALRNWIHLLRIYLAHKS